MRLGSYWRATAALRAGRLWGELSIAVAGKWVVIEAERAFGYQGAGADISDILNHLLNLDGVLSGAYRLRIILHR